MAFLEKADHLIDVARQEGSWLDILSLDVNGFKKINDTFGHEIGDALLVQVAERLRRVLPADDTVARTGGDEFAVLCRPADPLADADAVARLILQSMKDPFLLKGQQVEASVSIGIARFPADGADRSELLRNADLALDVAKSNRELPIRRFDNVIAHNARLKLQLEEELREAIGTDQIFLEFQPQFRTSSLAVVGFEALVRWMHPTRGRLSPDEFISLAEEAGLIVPLGRQVLEVACRVALHWPENVHIAVNLSPVQFRDPGIVETVQEVLARTGLPASRLELEVTEGVLIADEQQALRTLSQLRELGVTLALDDFGTGYASLSYLRKISFRADQARSLFRSGAGPRGALASHPARRPQPQPQPSAIGRGGRCRNPHSTPPASEARLPCRPRLPGRPSHVARSRRKHVPIRDGGLRRYPDRGSGRAATDGYRRPLS